MCLFIKEIKFIFCKVLENRKLKKKFIQKIKEVKVIIEQKIMGLSVINYRKSSLEILVIY